VAGIIAAQNNNLGIVGVAPDTKIHMVKVLGDYVLASSLVASFYNCRDAGAQIISSKLVLHCLFLLRSVQSSAP